VEKTILVVGGTGMLGRPVTKRLLAEGFAVRLLTHSPEKARKIFGNSVELAVGDVTHPDSLLEPMNGCDSVYINLGAKFIPQAYESVEHRGAVNIARMAAQKGIKRIAMISNLHVDSPESPYQYIAAKARAEEALKSCGLPYTIFKPCWFYESLPKFVQRGKAIILGRGDRTLSWLAASDYASQVARALQTEETLNRTYYIKGPEKYTLAEALVKLCEMVYPESKLSYIPFWLARVGSWFTTRQEMKGFIEFMKYFEKTPEPGVGQEAERVLGRATTTLEQWVQSLGIRPQEAGSGLK